MIFLWLLWLVVGFLIVVFGLIVFIGAPYLPTLKHTCHQALDLLNLKPGQSLVDLGSGDGVMLKAAAEAGLNVVGYELNPILLLAARLRTWRYRKQVKIKWQNFWRADVSQADGIFVFLLDRYMDRLDRKLAAEAKTGAKLVSHAFEIKNKEPAKKKRSLYLYKY